MKTPKFRLTYLIPSLIVAFLFTLYACEKNPNVITNEDTEELSTLDLKINVALDEATAANAFDDVSEIADEAINSFSSFLPTEFKAGNWNGNRRQHKKDTVRAKGNQHGRLGECVTIIRDVYPTGDTVIFTIDYGTEGCVTNDGKTRSGKIIRTIYGKLYWTGSSTSTTTFEDYIVDGNQILGTKIVNGIINDAGNREHTISITGQVILADDAGVISWNANRTREIVEGSDTRTKQDDVIHVTGSSSGVSADGSVFTSEIIEPLVRIHEQNCFRYYVAGINHITRGADTEITINYGDGTCDNLAEVTTNGVTETIELNKRRKKNQ